MAAPWKCFQSFFSFGCKFYKQSGCKGQSQTASPIKHQTPHLDPENIRESILDFTALFGEINPDMLYLCGGSLSGPERAVFASFPSVRRESIKKNVKSSIFRKKTSKFLSSLPFKTQTIDNQWEYDDASVMSRSTPSSRIFTTSLKSTCESGSQSWCPIRHSITVSTGWPELSRNCPRSCCACSSLLIVRKIPSLLTQCR